MYTSHSPQADQTSPPVSGGLLLNTQFCFHRLAFSGSLGGVWWRLQPWLGCLGFVLSLGQRVHHGHVNIEVVSLLKTLPTLVAGKLQLSLCFVFSHMVLQGCSLSTLEATDLTSGEEEKHRVGLGTCASPHCSQTAGAALFLDGAARIEGTHWRGFAPEWRI